MPPSRKNTTSDSATSITTTKPKFRRVRKYLSCENCIEKKIKCNKESFCAPCKMRKLDCRWVRGTPINTPSDAQALKEANSTIKHLRFVIDTLSTRLVTAGLSSVVETPTREKQLEEIKEEQETIDFEDDESSNFNVASPASILTSPASPPTPSNSYFPSLDGSGADPTFQPSPGSLPIHFFPPYAPSSSTNANLPSPFTCPPFSVDDAFSTASIATASNLTLPQYASILSLAGAVPTLPHMTTFPPQLAPHLYAHLFPPFPFATKPTTTTPGELLATWFVNGWDKGAHLDSGV